MQQHNIRVPKIVFEHYMRPSNVPSALNMISLEEWADIPHSLRDRIKYRSYCHCRHKSANQHKAQAYKAMIAVIDRKNKQLSLR